MLTVIATAYAVGQPSAAREAIGAAWLKLVHLVAGANRARFSSRKTTDEHADALPDPELAAAK